MAFMARPFLSVLQRSNQQYLSQLQKCITSSDRYLSSTCIIYGKRFGWENSGVERRRSTLSPPGFMTHFENHLEFRHPKVYKLYLLIKQGAKDYFVDTKMLYRVYTDMWKGKEKAKFSYKELDVYRQMPRDLLRVGPIVILLNIPITDIILPGLVYLFPRHLLCRHFWTPEQQSQFGEYYLHRRVQHFPKVLQYMREQSGKVQDPGQKRLLVDIIQKLEQKSLLSIEEILAVQPLFRDDQLFGRAALSSQHKSHLSQSMGFSQLGFRMSRQALLFYHTDMAIVREEVRSLPPQKIKEACFLRGLNAAACSDQQAADYLKNWIAISKQIDASTLSLLLHSPVLLAMNHPANMNLL